MAVTLAGSVLFPGHAGTCNINMSQSHVVELFFFFKDVWRLIYILKETYKKKKCLLILPF